MNRKHLALKLAVMALAGMMVAPPALSEKNRHQAASEASASNQPNGASIPLVVL